MADAQKAGSTPSPDTEGVRLADELTSAIRIGVEDDVTIPFDLSVRIHAFLRTAQNTGRDEVLEALRLASNALSCAAENGFYVGEGVFEKINAALSSPPVSTVDEEGGGQ